MATPTYKYEDEDQSSDGGRPKPGQKVRHAQFGVGTVREVDPRPDFRRDHQHRALGGVELRLLVRHDVAQGHLGGDELRDFAKAFNYDFLGEVWRRRLSEERSADGSAHESDAECRADGEPNRDDAPDDDAPLRWCEEWLSHPSNVASG